MRSWNTPAVPVFHQHQLNQGNHVKIRRNTARHSQKAIDAPNLEPAISADVETLAKLQSEAHEPPMQSLSGAGMHKSVVAFRQFAQLRQRSREVCCNSRD